MIRTTLVAAAAILLLGTGSHAQQTAQTPAQPSQPPAQRASPQIPQIPLKVQLVLARYQGEKKIISLPYVLGVTANTAAKTSLRMGVEVPVSTGSGGYTYRPVGTNIDCEARTISEGQYYLSFTISDSSIQFDAKGQPKKSAMEIKAPNAPEAAVAISVPDAPSFRSFNSSFTMLLRDGQTAQSTSATDPVSGEVMKIDVTLNVLK